MNGQKDNDLISTIIFWSVIANVIIAPIALALSYFLIGFLRGVLL